MSRLLHGAEDVLDAVLDAVLDVVLGAVLGARSLRPKEI